jgi:hypothetical protein
MNWFAKIMILACELMVTGTATTFGNDLVVTSFAEFAGETNILLQATGNITLTGNLALPELPPGANSGLLTVQAGNDIIIENSSFISTAQRWSFSFQAVNSVQIDGMFPPNLNDTTVSGGVVTIVSGSQGGIIPGPVSPFQLIQINRQVRDNHVTVLAGTNVVFNFIAGDSAPLYCQWLKNGRMLRNETGEFLSLTNIRPADAGDYTIVVRDARGRFVAYTVHLRVQPQPPYRIRHWPLRY